MKILSVEASLPSKRITNNDAIELVYNANKDHMSESELDYIKTRLSNYLEYSGTEIRYRRDQDEKAIDVCKDACNKAIAKSGLKPEDIDLLIYAGVGRGCAEPAMANIVQHEMGLVNATCFDVMDACASWLRSLQTAQAFMKSKMYKNIMIVNCEFGVDSNKKTPGRIEKAEDIDHITAGFTVGEASTATILTDDGNDDNFYFYFKNFGQYAHLCMIPLPDLRQYSNYDFDERYQSLKFYTDTHKLFISTITEMTKIYRSNKRLHEAHHDIVFGHSISKKADETSSKALNIPREKCFGEPEKYGNVVSASAPLALCKAVEQGRLTEGMKILIAFGAAGITIGFASFTF